VTSRGNFEVVASLSVGRRGTSKIMMAAAYRRSSPGGLFLGSDVGVTAQAIQREELGKVPLL
jgi:hypothetical protein